MRNTAARLSVLAGRGEEEVLSHSFVSDAMASYVKLCGPLSTQIVSDMML